MRTTLIVLCVLCLSDGPVLGDLGRGQIDLAKAPQLQPHYQPEFIFDTNLDAVACGKPASGLIWFVTSYRICRTRPGVSVATSQITPRTCCQTASSPLKDLICRRERSARYGSRSIFPPRPGPVVTPASLRFNHP